MSYEHILVPLDGSLLAEYIMPHVERLASDFHAEVTLLHVIEAQESAPEKLTPSQKIARADITRYLKRMAKTLEGKQIPNGWRVAFGEPVHEIVQLALKGEVDLVMMSTHGYGGRERDRLGSVAMAVVSSGAAPVLLVKPPDSVASR